MLPLHFVVLLAGIQGLSEALPVSRSGHDAVLRIWLEPGPSGARLEAVLHLATAAALAFAARRRLAGAVGAGLLAITRPSLFRSSAPAHDAAVLTTATAASLLSRVIIDHVAAPWKMTPVAMGFGLLLTGLMLGTTMLVGGEKAPTTIRESPRTDGPSVPLALLLGLGHGMAALPGGSDMGVALVLLTWMGTKNDLALDLALLLSAAVLFVNGLVAVQGGLVFPDLSWPAIFIAFVTAFLGTTVSIGATRILVEKRALALAALWIVPLGLATLAYSRASSEGLALTTFTRLTTNP